MANIPILILFPISVFLFCYFTIAPVSCLNNETDLLSLLAFKSTILVDPYGAIKSWNETAHFCSWKGVVCDHSYRDRVIGINLTSEGLVGSLSPHVGNLSFLRNINLQNNSFHGQIPQEMGLLRQLEFVEFSDNFFDGELPKNLSQCQNLVSLYLINNKLSGLIPPGLGSLHKLKELGLSWNNFFGTIPSSFGNLTSLTTLSLGRCGLKGGNIPESLAQLRSLEFLHVGENNLTGEIPLGLFNISTLQIFVVKRNKLQGEIPSTIGFTLPNLQHLILNTNQFDGNVPYSLSNSTSLERIVLHINNFIGPLPKDLGRLVSLEEFIISTNNIKDDINFISSLTNCTKLQILEVDENPLTGSLPRSIGNLSSNLETLLMYSTQIHGIIPNEIMNLFGLTRLFLSKNFLEGPIPLGIGNLVNLQQLYLDANRFYGEIPNTMGNLTMLDELDLTENNFSGTIPPSLSNCTSLRSLNISHNTFSGLIPKEVMSLSSMTILLDMSYNAFTGSIPSEVGALTNLARLDLSNNRLSGFIPNSLGSCLSLEWISLQGNSLEGEIPLGLKELKGLQDLDLSRNNLSGLIPSFLGNLRLEYLNLSFNGLQGEVPKTGVFGNTSTISLDGNQELCGGILELKLPPCPSINSSKTNMSTLLKVLIPIVAIGGICLTLSVVFICLRRNSESNYPPPSIPSSINAQFMRLSYADLFKAIGGFLESNVIGSGKFGTVYKGILDDEKTLIAVKVLNLFVRGASKSFMAEMNALKGIRHRNLLKILSICDSIDFQGNPFKALVYEFKANGNLEKWLYDRREQGNDLRKLTIIERLKIAIDIAHALEYLHFGTDSTIVHGDLKPCNILLDQNMTAYVGDFGLAKIISTTFHANESCSSSSLAIRGTLGYVPPEYGTNNSVSTQGDVYSYGILLLEMFTTTRPTDDSLKDHINLHNFVCIALPNRVTEILDPYIQSELNINRNIKDYMVSILSIGLACSTDIPRDRMLITDVVHELQNIRDVYEDEYFS